MPRFVVPLIKLDKAMLDSGRSGALDYVNVAYLEREINSNSGYIDTISRLRSRQSTGSMRFMQSSAFDCALLHALKAGISESTLEVIAYKLASGDIDFNDEAALFKLREHCIATYKNRRHGSLARIQECCYIQQYLYDYINGGAKTKNYRKPKPMFALSLISNA